MVRRNISATAERVKRRGLPRRARTGSPPCRRISLPLGDEGAADARTRPDRRLGADCARLTRRLLLRRRAASRRLRSMLAEQAKAEPDGAMTATRTSSLLKLGSANIRRFSDSSTRARTQRLQPEPRPQRARLGGGEQVARPMCRRAPQRRSGAAASRSGRRRRAGAPSRRSARASPRADRRCRRSGRARARAGRSRTRR